MHACCPLCFLSFLWPFRPRISGSDSNMSLSRGTRKTLRCARLATAMLLLQTQLLLRLCEWAGGEARQRPCAMQAAA